MKTITFTLRCVKRWPISFIAVLAIFVSIGIISSNTVNAEENEIQYYSGCLEDDLEVLNNHLVTESIDDDSDLCEAALPNKVDLTSKFPTPGNQGNQGSCTAWAVCYALKSYQESQEHGWGISSSATQFSPAFVYNQINGGKDNGSSISKALDLLIEQGVCTLKYMPYNVNDYKTQPNSAQKNNASNFKAKSWSSIRGVNSVKYHLAKGSGVVIRVYCYSDFSISTSNPIYDTIKSGEKKPNTGHAICLIGYDDSKQAFKFINSWGTNWGINGYGYISYKMFEDSRNSNGWGYIMTDDTNQHYKKQIIGVKALKDVNIYSDTTLKNKVGVINKDSSIKITDFIKASNGNPPVFKVSNGYITTKKDEVKESSTFTIKYNANGGTGTMANTTVVYGVPEKLRKNTFEKRGYVFKGWYAYRTSDSKWAYKNNTTGESGWFLEDEQPDGYSKYLCRDQQSVSKLSKIDKNVFIYYAQWQKCTFIVSYKSNGGTGSMADTNVPYAVATKLRANAFKRTGFTFNGWCAYRTSDSKWFYKNSSTGKTGWYEKGKQPSGYSYYIYANQQAVARLTTINNNKVYFYAQWKKNS